MISYWVGLITYYNSRLLRVRLFSGLSLQEFAEPRTTLQYYLLELKMLPQVSLLKRPL